MQENICNVQHHDLEPSWIVYLHWLKLPYLLSQCKHFSPLGHLLKVAAIFHPSRWISKISFEGSKVFGGCLSWGGWENEITTICGPWCSQGLQ